MNPTSYKIDSRLLPQRLREASFRKYEKRIAAIVSQFPNRVTVNLGDNVPITVAARLRDAIDSLYKYEWETAEIDIEKFRRERHKIIVSHRGHEVLAGSQESLREEVASGEALAMDVRPQEDTPILHSVEEKRLLCWLAANRFLSKSVRVYGINEDEVKFLEANFDVRIDTNSDGTTSII